ncbi:MAG: hypothetical protein AB1461_18460 [Thermodesulfobacteriota bacterium]
MPELCGERQIVWKITWLREDEIMLFDQMTLYANESEKNQHNNAIRQLCEELAENEEAIRPVYEEILLEMKKQARIKEFLSILVCRTIRDLARGHVEGSYPGLADSRTMRFRLHQQHALRPARPGEPASGE